MVLAALISLIATEAAGLIAAIGLLITRKTNGNAAGSRPTEFWEVRFREIVNDVRDNHDDLQYIKWLLTNRTHYFDELRNSLSAQGIALGQVANELQRLLERDRR